MREFILYFDYRKFHLSCGFIREVGGGGRGGVRGYSFFFAGAGGNDAGFRAGGPSSMHKLPYVSILFCILPKTYRLCMKNRI